MYLAPAVSGLSMSDDSSFTVSAVVMYFHSPSSEGTGSRTWKMVPVSTTNVMPLCASVNTSGLLASRVFGVGAVVGAVVGGASSNRRRIRTYPIMTNIVEHRG